MTSSPDDSVRAPSAGHRHLPPHLVRRPTDDDPGLLGTDPRFVVPALIEEWYRNDPDRPFLVEADTGRAETYGSFRELTRRWATVLLDRRVGAGDRVVSLLPSSIDAHAVWVATSLIGAIDVPVDPALRGSFLDHVLTQARPTAYVVRAGHEPVLAGTGVAGRPMISTESGASPADDAAPADVPSLPRPTDTSCVIFTSGTSGPAKAVVLSWAQMATTIGRIPRSWLSGDDRMYSPWPMFHVTGRSPLTTMADVGGQVITRERFSRRDFWNDIDRHGCTVASAGAVAGLLLADRTGSGGHRHGLRHVFLGSGPTAAKFIERFGVNGIACYGSTEVGFPLVSPTQSEDDVDSIGRLRHGYLSRVVDDRGRDVPAGESGELWIRPPSRTLMFTEYLDDPVRTAAAVDGDGWYHTGDAVRRDEDGRFFFVDRQRDTIRRFGENISSKQIELAVLADGDVAECAAVGVDDEVSGQEVALFVVAAPGRLIDPAELSDRLDGMLADHMRPVYIAVRDELPRTPNGKVRKGVLVDGLEPEEMWQRRPDGRDQKTTA